MTDREGRVARGALSPSASGSASAELANTPGRATAAQGSSSREPSALDLALASARHHTAQLGRALAAVDYLSAWDAARALRAALQQAEQQISAAPEDAEWARRVAETKQASDPLLAIAPDPGPEVLASAMTDPRAWHAAEHRWIAERRAAANPQAAISPSRATAPTEPTGATRPEATEVASPTTAKNSIGAAGAADSTGAARSEATGAVSPTSPRNSTGAAKATGAVSPTTARNSTAAKPTGAVSPTTTRKSPEAAKPTEAASRTTAKTSTGPTDGSSERSSSAASQPASRFASSADASHGRPGVGSLFGVPSSGASRAGTSSAGTESPVSAASSAPAAPSALATRPAATTAPEGPVSTPPLEASPITDMLRQFGANDEAETAEDAPRAPGTAAEYLYVNSSSAWRAVASYLRQVGMPEVSPRLTWAEPAFIDATLAAIHDHVCDFTPGPLTAVLYPHDVLAAIDPLRPRDRKIWSPSIGTVLGQLFHGVLAASVRRMAARYVDAADAQWVAAPGCEATVELGQLVTSHPMDRFVARGLTTRGVAAVVPDAEVWTGQRKPPPTGLRPVKLAWAGDADPRLWNFVRAEPADATAEEVAASLFAYARGQFAGDATSFFAYGLAAAPPLFGLPASWAIRFPAARAHAPEALRHGQVPDLATDTIGARLAAVASSSAADPLALQQASTGQRDPRAAAMSAVAVTETLGDCLIQLDVLRRELTPWELGGDLAGARSYVARKQGELRTAPADQIAARASIALGQRDRLYRIAGAVRSVTAAAGSLAPSQRTQRAAPLRQILTGLAAAASTSHLAATSQQLFNDAEAMQASLGLRSLQANVVHLESAMDEAHAVSGSDKHNRDLARPYLEVQDDARRLERRMLGGGEVSAEELERVQLSAQELALRARLHGLQIQLDQLQRAGDEALVGLTAHIAQYGSSRFRHLHDATQLIHDVVGDIYLDLATELRAAPPSTAVPTDAGALLITRRAALTRAQQRFAQLATNRELANFLASAARAVRNQQIRAALVQVGLMIGISILTSGAGGWIAEGLGEAYLAVQGVETVGQLSLGARAAIQVGTLATETTGNAIGQQLTTGGSLGGSLVDNAVFSLGTAGTLGVIARDLHAATAFEKLLTRELAAIDTAEARAATAMNRWAKTGRAAAWTARQAGAITSHTVMGMALGSLAARLHGAPHAGPAQLDEWLIQGAAVALGKLTHAALGERMPSYARLARRTDAAHAQRLYAEARQLQALAAAIAHSPEAHGALELLHRRRQLLETEITALDELAGRHGTGAHDGPSAEELGAMRADLEAQLAEVRSQGMLDLGWHLLGLHELAPGVWSGTPEQLAAAASEAQASGRRVERASDSGDGVHRLTVDGKPIELHERARAAEAHDEAVASSSITAAKAPPHDGDPSQRGKPAMPGEARAAPKTPIVTAAQHAVAARLGPDVTAIGIGRYHAPPARLAELHATWQARQGANVSRIHYDAETNTSHFELDVDARRVRIEAPLAPRIDSFAQIDAGTNRIVGRPIAAGDGPGLLRALVNHDAAALAAVGLSDAARMPRDSSIEFGLGETADGRAVVIRGEDGAVDWSALPGIKPIGHTHPSVKNNDLPARDGATAKREISLDELVRPTKDPLLVRELIFPSVADFLVMAHLGIDGHRVYTPFVVRDGVVMKPGAGQVGPRLEFAIGQPTEVGKITDGRRVYRSRVEGSIEGQSGKPPIVEDVWIIEDGGGSSGHLYMTEPAEMTRTPGPGGKSATKTHAKALTRPLEHLAKQHGEPAVQWAHDSLPDADVEPLLKQLAPATLTTIVDIPATEVRALIDQITPTRVNDALSLGPTGPMHGKQLEALRRQVAPPVLIDLFDSAGTSAGRLQRLARIADGLEPANAMSSAEPLGSSSVTIDNNARIAVDELVRGVGKAGKKIDKFSDLDLNYQNAINGLRQARGLGVYIDPPTGTRPTVESIVGSGTDLRTTQIIGAEAMTNETPTSRSPALAAMTGARTNRAHPDYALVLDELKTSAIGGSKGAVDRSLIVDTMFSEATDTPKLVTADRVICVGLARGFVASPRKFLPTGHGGLEHWEQLLARFPEGHFTVEIRGHKLEVYFHEGTHIPPYPP